MEFYCGLTCMLRPRRGRGVALLFAQKQYDRRRRRCHTPPQLYSYILIRTYTRFSVEFLTAFLVGINVVAVKIEHIAVLRSTGLCCVPFQAPCNLQACCHNKATPSSPHLSAVPAALGIVCTHLAQIAVGALNTPHVGLSNRQAGICASGGDGGGSGGGGGLVVVVVHAGGGEEEEEVLGFGRWGERCGGWNQNQIKQSKTKTRR